MSWTHIRGHEYWVQAFADVVKRGRLAHAYLFCGPPGIGKKMFAVELAKTLLCERAGSEFVACTRCPACVQVDAGTHPDLIRAARPEDKVEFPIAVMLGVLAQMTLKSARGGYKVAIIDDADDLNDESANAFLKTLEEPPPNSLVMLLATDPEGQLATIVSRCQVIRFKPLPASAVADILRAQNVDAARADQLARLSDGSPGLALGLADEALWQFRQKMLAILALPTPDTVLLAHDWEAFVEDAEKEAGGKRRRAARCIDLLLDVLDSAMQMTVGIEPASVAVAERPIVRTLAERYGLSRLLQLTERCLEAKQQIDRMVQLVLVEQALVDAFS